MPKRTKIVCTIGPACESVETIAKMVKAGMNVARLNFSHGTYENHYQLLKNIRQVAKAADEPVAIMQDLQGPKIRVGILPPEGVVLKVGEMVAFDTAVLDHAEGVIPIDYAELHHYLKPGERLLLNDGRIETKVVRVSETRVNAEVIVGGVLTSHKGINVPDSTLTVRAMTEKDKEDLRFGVVHEVDYVALSFVRSPDDILDARYLIKEYEEEMGLHPVQPIRIIAKIERHEAVENIEAILDVADGIMVARGDLGVETPAQEVPLVQKRLIDAALAAAKPVIVATQMLDSMQENPRPTRAEVSDVANAVIDHTDAVMLSNETATGKFPVETVTTMAEIIEKTEASHYDNLAMREHSAEEQQLADIMSELSRLLAERVKAKLIVTASVTGTTARLISRYRPELPIVVGAESVRVQRQLNLSWGVLPFVLTRPSSIEELTERSIVYLKKKKIVARGDEIIVVAGEPVGQVGHINLLEVREVN
ncbi:MAG: pyruvate kinase [Candidatus Magasanikbacteria bacterium]|nr:pyruvate kinase [Candidatus Magasanikbacteria bacterium]